MTCKHTVALKVSSDVLDYSKCVTYGAQLSKGEVVEIDEDHVSSEELTEKAEFIRDMQREDGENV